MPAKRRTLDRQRRPPISPEAVRLWKLCLEIEDERATERWETDRPPGRRREYLDVHRALATACGLDWCSCIGRPMPNPRRYRPVCGTVICRPKPIEPRTARALR